MPLAARVPMALLVLSSVTLPPRSASLSALTKPLAPSVTVPVPVSEMMLVPVAVSPALMLMLPPKMLIGPAMLVAVSMLMLAVLPLLPSDSPPTPLSVRAE